MAKISKTQFVVAISTILLILSGIHVYPFLRVSFNFDEEDSRIVDVVPKETIPNLAVDTNWEKTDLGNISLKLPMNLVETICPTPDNLSLGFNFKEFTAFFYLDTPSYRLRADVLTTTSEKLSIFKF